MLNFFPKNVVTQPWIGSFFDKISLNQNLKLLFCLLTIVLGSFLLIISSKIKVPLYPVPMTLQPLAVLLIAMLYGRNLATITVGLYILKGMLGFPVFAYGGGVMYLLGPTGGFIFGFFICALVVGYLADRNWGKSITSSVVCMMVGMIIIYFFGILQLSIIKGFDYALLTGFYPFLLGDFYKLLFLGIIIPYIWKVSK